MQWKASPSRRRSSTRLPDTARELAATSMMRKAATTMTMPSALEISRQATLKPVTEIAADAGLPPWLIEPYGEHVAKIDLAAIGQLADRPRARYVLVTAITPTPLGEGKTTTTIGLGQGMRVIGKRATIALRQALGLTTHPAAEHMDIDADGRIVGLS